MIKYYLKIAFRNLVKYKIFSVINIAGLAIGITATLLITMYVVKQLSFEDVHENRNNIYRANIDFTSGGQSSLKMAGVMNALGPAAEKAIPEINNSTRFYSSGTAKIEANDKKFNEGGFYFVDPAFFKIFTFPMIEGNTADPFADPYSVVLTESTAEKIFGNKDAVGKKIHYNEKYNLTVTAVAKDIPENTAIQWDYLVPFSLLAKINPGYLTWTHFGDCYTYFLVNDKIEKKSLDKKLNALLKEHTGKMSDFFNLYTIKLTDIYLHSDVFSELGPRGNITYIYLFSSVAALILLIACFNFMNLSTSRSIQRSKEVGLKKVLGAGRFSLIKQFLGESIFITAIAVLISLILYELLNPLLNDYLNIAVKGNYSSVYFFLLLGGVILVVGFFAGIYPALFLSKYSPVETLKGIARPGSGGLLIRKGLVIFQFIISIFLIVCTVAIFKQLNFMKNADLGFDKSNVVLLDFPASSKNGEDNYNLLKTKLLENPDIKGVSGVYTLPGISSKDQETISLKQNSPDDAMSIRAIGVDYGFINTLKVQLLQGRNFSEKYATDRNDAIIINQQAVKLLGLKNPVGHTVYIPGSGKGLRPATVIGVVKDFNIESLKKKIDPYFLFINPKRFFTVAIKISPEKQKATINYISSTWKSVLPGKRINYSFLTDTYNEIYSSEDKMGELFIIFASLAVFIACLGLFGLSTFTAELKTKEIGIRKVLGASVPGLSILLSKEFVKWVLIADILAIPLSIIAVHKWLEEFAFKTKIGPDIFAFASLIVLVISVLTISIQIIRTALTNPVETLKYE